MLSRLVAQRSLFGVTEDPLGFDVARTALWLHTFVPGMPLPLLDHHLRAGNGVLGADLSSVAAATGLTNLPQEIVEAASSLFALSERVDTTALDVRWSSGQFRRVEEALAPYRLLFDLAVSATLGEEDAAAALQSVALSAPWQAHIADFVPDRTTTGAEDEGFLHWELAFPEVHIDWVGNAWDAGAGFEVVVGAPPWLATSDEPIGVYSAGAGRPGSQTLVSEPVVRYLKARFGASDGGAPQTADGPQTADAPRTATPSSMCIRPIWHLPEGLCPPQAGVHRM